jgi:hypothetical protein
LKIKAGYRSITAGDHHALVVCPFMHDGATLQGRIVIPADSIPRLSAEFCRPSMVKVIMAAFSSKQLIARA